jgi:hypothetical protein
LGKGNCTQKQGQYLVFTYSYTKIQGRPPAEAEMERYFKVADSSVQQNDIDFGKVMFDSTNSRSSQVDMTSFIT